MIDILIHLGKPSRWCGINEKKRQIDCVYEAKLQCRMNCISAVSALKLTIILLLIIIIMIIIMLIMLIIIIIITMHV